MVDLFSDPGSIPGASTGTADQFADSLADWSATCNSAARPIRLFAAVLILGSTPAAFAQRSILVGTVSRDSAGKQPIPNAEVSLSSPRLTVRTDSTGSYQFSGLNQGQYLVTVRSIGHSSVYDTVTVDSDDGILRNFVLVDFVPTLTPVVTKEKKQEYLSPMLRGFEDRRAEGFGHFIPEADLRKLDNERLSDILAARVPGMKLVPGKGGGTYVVSTRKPCVRVGLCDPKAPCYATVYFDGVLIYDSQLSTGPTASPPNMEDYNVNQLAGVEFYAGEATAPLGYRHSGCGLLLLWTREK